MLRNRKEAEVTQLKGIIMPEAADPTKLKFGQFERLQNMSFGGLGSLKRKTGVSALDGVENPDLTINFQPNFARSDCETITPTSSDECVDCLSISPDNDSVIAKSAEATDPCFCFLAGQLCFNRVIGIELEFVAALAGNGISGVALCIPPDATATDFSGYGLVYTPGTLTLAKWTNASLQTIETTLDTDSVTLNTGDIISLTYDTVTGDLIGYVNDVEQLSANDTDLNDSDNQGVGLIVVGNTGADDRLEWTELFAECFESSGFVCCDCMSVSPFNIQCCPTIENPDCTLTCDEVPLVLRPCGGQAPYTWNIIQGSASINEIIGSECIEIIHAPPAAPSTAIAYVKGFIEYIQLTPGNTCAFGPHVGEERKTVAVSSGFRFYTCNQTLRSFDGSFTCIDAGGLEQSWTYVAEECSGPINEGNPAGSLGFRTTAHNLASNDPVFTQTYNFTTCPGTPSFILTLSSPGTQETDFVPLYSEEVIQAMCNEGCDETPVIIQCIDNNDVEAFFEV